jgi:hypothetical protein
MKRTAMVIALLLTQMSFAGCGGGQDEGQPAVGSISASPRADDDGLIKKPGNAAPKKE